MRKHKKPFTSDHDKEYEKLLRDVGADSLPNPPSSVFDFRDGSQRSPSPITTP